MKIHRSLPDQGQYDPTPDEVAAAERARPTKVPLCLRCKVAPRLAELPEDARQRLAKASTMLGDLVRRRTGELTRAEAERVGTAHLHLGRAGKGRLCARCVDSSVSYAIDIITGLDQLDVSSA